MAQFVFAPVYLNNTPGMTADDGIPIFGTGLNASTLNPIMIGQIMLQNFANAPVVTITGTNFNAATGTFNGDTLAFANPGSLGDGSVTVLNGQPIMSFDAAGRLMLTDPTGLLSNLNGPGYFNFNVTVTDGAGTTFLNQSVFINVKQDVGGTAYSIQVGDHSFASADINDPAQIPRVDNLFDTAGNDLLIAGEGNQASPLFGNVLRSSNGGNDALVGGSGRDLLIHDGSTGSVKMFGMNGDDTLKVRLPFILTAGPTVADGGNGSDTLILGPLGATGGFNFDLTASNTIFNIEKMLIEGGTSITNTVTLDVRDVFEMTTAGNHRLMLGMAGGTLAEVHIANSSPENDFAITASDGSSVTYTGIHNSQTVTLIIETNPNLTVLLT
jgi:hypothetical protein